ncbi:uncharacterized protein LOC107045836 [Diachasma alloeum]|uniref:uncharacterized protein LOC107045836 n=1 Tax=Diachasma alloeum TaxID=454923 RepID=UPI0007383DE6|nr:uncharacterized protein LOC107045836 [Diachasma alloeum]
MKMTPEVAVARRIAAPAGLTVEKVRLSSINRLFPQFGKDCEVLLICYISPEEVAKLVSPKRENEDGNAESLDVTGSPLEHSFGDDSFNVSSGSLRRNWLKYEERYTPIDLKMAAEMVNCTRETLSDDDLWTTPLFVIADPEENDEKCVLVGCYPDPRGFMPLRARLAGVSSLSDIQERVQLEVPLTQHNTDDMNPRSRKKAQVRVTSVYEICGVDPEMVDWGEEEKEDFGGHLRIEASWDELSFLPPLRKSSSTLIASIASGSKSPLSPLWDQLLLLDKYIEILDEYQTKHSSSRYSVAPLNFPKDFANAFVESTPEIMKKLHRVLTGEDALDDAETMDDTPAAESTSEDDYQIKLSDVARALERRQDQEFASIFWRIIKGTGSYTAMTDCIHTVFEAIVMDNFKPSLNAGDDTRFARLVGGLDSTKKQLPQLAGSVSMELVVDMGLEKLARDYTYLLSTGSLMENYDARKMMRSVAEGAFDISKYREKLVTLAQIHTSLEFLQLIQNQLNCRMDVSRSIFDAALKVYRSPNSPLKFGDLRNQGIYSLEVPAPKDIISEVVKTPPSSWMCTLTSDTVHQSYNSITHYSRNPIFPPNIYTPEDVQKVEGDIEGPMYHVTTGCIIRFKLS